MPTPAVTAWLREEAPLCGPITVNLSGGCMEPHLRDGSRVRVVPARRYRAGDIVATVGPDERIYAHRLLGTYRWRGRKLYLTQADRSSRADAATPHVLGRIEQCADPSPLVRWRSRVLFLRALLRRLAVRLGTVRQS